MLSLREVTHQREGMGESHGLRRRLPLDRIKKESRQLFDNTLRVILILPQPPKTPANNPWPWKITSSLTFLNPFLPTVAYSKPSPNICCPRDVSLSDSKCWNGGHEWVKGSASITLCSKGDSVALCFSSTRVVLPTFLTRKGLNGFHQQHFLRKKVSRAVSVR